jgi:hypothetical protein
MDPNQILNTTDNTIITSDSETPQFQYPGGHDEFWAAVEQHRDSLYGLRLAMARIGPVVPPLSQRHCCQPIRFRRLYCYGCFTVLKFVSYCPHLLSHNDFLSETICYDCKFNSSWALATDDPSYLEE